MNCAVVTTIQPPTASLRALSRATQASGMDLLIVGDRKTPSSEWPRGCRYWSIDAQRTSAFTLGRLLPENHYVRKNLGYLDSIARGAHAIFDTDDDNAPLPAWRPRSLEARAGTVAATGWVNVYSYFTAAHVWPRGFPLEYVRQRVYAEPSTLQAIEAPIQQSVVNGSPDVDAVWRLIQEQDLRFDTNPSVCLGPGAWCPFNSQSTWWFPKAYPLMYLPTSAGFRMTDIWRSFVAQRCIWELGTGVVYHGPEMVQDRNPHDLLRDFEQEIPGYLGNVRFCSVLSEARLSTSPSALEDNLYRCYELLVRARFLPPDEMRLIDAWLSDLRTACCEA